MHINVTGLFTPGGDEDRDIVYLTVTNGANTYNWQWYMPLNTGMDVGSYITSQTAYIEADVTAKEAAFSTVYAADNTTDPNTIICPTIPDYYALRRAAYPPIANQVGALLSPNATPSLTDLQSQIAQVKATYPKPSWMTTNS